MNHRKVTPDVKQVLLILLNNKIPLKLIGFLLNINAATLVKAVPKQYKEDAEDFSEGNNQIRLHLLQLYAWLLADHSGCIAAIGTPVAGGLLEILPAYLHLNEWEKYLEGALSYKKLSEANTFAEDVPDGYRKLIEALYPSPVPKITAKESLEAALIAMHKEEIPFPLPNEIRNPKKALNNYVASKLVCSEKEARHFDGSFIVVLRELLNGLYLREAEMVCSYFGLTDHHKITRGEVLDKYDLTDASYHQIKNKALNRIKHRLFRQYGLIEETYISDHIGLVKCEAVLQEQLEKVTLVAEESERSLKVKLRFLAACFKEDRSVSSTNPQVWEIVLECFPELRKENEEMRDPFLLGLQTPIEDLELSVRAFHCMRDGLGARTLADIVRSSEADLYALKNFGQKTFSEIDQMLHERNLHLGMVL